MMDKSNFNTNNTNNENNTNNINNYINNNNNNNIIINDHNNNNNYLYNNITNILYKENDFLKNKIQVLNQQNTSLYKIISDMKELMIKFEQYPKLISYWESSLKEKDIEISNIKKKYDEEFYRLNDIINKQIETDNLEKKKKEEIIEGLKKTVEDIENQKYIDNNEYENQITELKGKIINFVEKEKDYLKVQSDLIAEKEWFSKTKNNEIIIIENSKKEVEKQLNDATKENEYLKKQIANYQNNYKLSQQRQFTNNINGGVNNPYLVISPTSSTSSTSSNNNIDEYQTKSTNITTSHVNNTNHLPTNNKKPISISKKQNW